MNGISLSTQLNTQRIKNLGLMERYSLHKTGEADGAIGLPKPDMNGWWVSPLMEREHHAFQESSDRLYGQLQISTRKLYEEVNNLADVISKCLADIYSIDEEIKKVSSAFDMKKKNKGEANLSDDQIAARRSKELSGMTAGLKAKREQLLENAERSYYRLLEKKAKITVLNDATKLIDEKVKEHSLQRIAYYWDYAYRCHPDQQSMPSRPDCTISSNAETVYYERHKNIDEKSIKTIESYESYKKVREEVK